MQIPLHVDAKYFHQVQNFMTKVSTRIFHIFFCKFISVPEPVEP